MSVTPQFKKKEFRTLQDIQVTSTCYYRQVTITIRGTAAPRVGDEEEVTHFHLSTAFSALSTLYGMTVQSSAVEFALLIFTYLLDLG